MINSGTYSTALTVNETRAVVELVGGRCTIKFVVNSKPPPELLLETGAQVSLINKDKLESNSPDVPI